VFDFKAVPGKLRVVAKSRNVGHNFSTKTYKNIYTLTTKDVEFRGSSLTDLRDFPQSAMREVGHQLDKVQNGLAPDDAKPMPTIGAGVMELRIWYETGTFRVVYVAKFEDAVYVLHCFKKKTQQTSQPDIELARKRFKELVKEISK
jgi:phage-related protein